MEAAGFNGGSAAAGVEVRAAGEVGEEVPALVGLVMAAGMLGVSPRTRRTLLAWVLPW